MERTKCEECGGKIVKRNVEFKMYGESLGFFPAEVCTKCKEEVFDEKTSSDIDDAAKKNGLWGLGSSATVIRIGSSTGFVINKKISEFLGLKKGEEVYMYPENRHRIIIEVH